MALEIGVEGPGTAEAGPVTWKLRVFKKNNSGGGFGQI